MGTDHVFYTLARKPRANGTRKRALSPVVPSVEVGPDQLNSGVGTMLVLSGRRDRKICVEVGVGIGFPIQVDEGVGTMSDPLG